MSTLQLTITWYKIHHANDSTLRRRISETKRSRSVNNYLYFFLLYKHRCFTGISATEKSYIFSDVKIRYFYSQSEVFFCCYNNVQFWAGIVWRVFCHSLLNFLYRLSSVTRDKFTDQQWLKGLLLLTSTRLSYSWPIKDASPEHVWRWIIVVFI